MPRRDSAANADDLLSRTDDGTLCLRLEGDWRAGELPLSIRDVDAELLSSPISRLTFESGGLKRWDSGLLIFLMKLMGLCDERKAAFDDGNLPAGVRRLLDMASYERRGGPSRREERRTPFLERVADGAIGAREKTLEKVEFLGKVTVAFGRMLTGRACCRLSDLLLIMQDCGARALPIVSLISLMVGLIFAFVGAVQLSDFGAQIYVASLVGIAIVRVMGAIMTGIIMAGRTGSAFAAHLGTMQANEEIDALVTLGIDPIEFLVLPRVLALSLMMPLLCLYADLMGVLGGLIVGVFMLDLNVMEYLSMTRESLQLKNFWIGLFHSAVFGVLVAMVGCLQGLQCERSAGAVGEAATSAVVNGIVNIIVATAIITVICNILGI